ncbi:MAG: antitoxin [Deltaproteobacteria bacterium RIFOXYA12_FULL_58_15]|nr:MAG: antitoxin [Deltaproteobacteria bacterium RIFOXYA12_FULL_58_15]OGR12201.1 MAG: antitoxin [Deltaproteobacteria bacterium RIFOXYB12_FULL_58_9]
MALSIKNPEAERLAIEVAKRTGETMTRAVIVALEERLERLSGQRRAPDVVDALKEISIHCSSLPDDDIRSAEEILGYDDRGGFGD